MSETDLEILVAKIKKQLKELNDSAWNVLMERRGSDRPDDDATYMFYGSRMLYYKICAFLEYKNLPEYLALFKSKFNPIIDDKKKVTKTEGPRYEDSDPSYVILDDFREFLSPFNEFDFSTHDKLKNHKLKLILAETKAILNKMNVNVIGETSIYNAIKWYIELIYPSTRSLNKSRFIKKFGTYKPDILIPEISTAIEYKLIKSSKVLNTFLDQLKNDADAYIHDPEYRLFYAVVYFKENVDVLKASFEHAIREKKFPDNWEIISV